MAKGYWIARLDIKDEAACGGISPAQRIAFAKYGGKFLVRGGPAETGKGPARPAQCCDRVRHARGSARLSGVSGGIRPWGASGSVRARGRGWDRVTPPPEYQAAEFLDRVGECRAVMFPLDGPGTVVGSPRYTRASLET